jgi:hypothetical protein
VLHGIDAALQLLRLLFEFPETLIDGIEMAQHFRETFIVLGQLLVDGVELRLEHLLIEIEESVSKNFFHNKLLKSVPPPAWRL